MSHEGVPSWVSVADDGEHCIHLDELLGVVLAHTPSESLLDLAEMLLPDAMEIIGDIACGPELWHELYRFAGRVIKLDSAEPDRVAMLH